jgi:serine/threonine protein kinase
MLRSKDPRRGIRASTTGPREIARSTCRPSRSGWGGTWCSVRWGAAAWARCWEAFDRTLDRKVAEKVLHRDLVQRQRLVREAQALAKLSHPHVVQVYEVGEADEG